MYAQRAYSAERTSAGERTPAADRTPAAAADPGFKVDPPSTPTVKSFFKSPAYHPTMQLGSAQEEALCDSYSVDDEEEVEATASSCTSTLHKGVTNKKKQGGFFSSGKKKVRLVSCNSSLSTCSEVMPSIDSTGVRVPSTYVMLGAAGEASQVGELPCSTGIREHRVEARTCCFSEKRHKCLPPIPCERNLHD